MRTFATISLTLGLLSGILAQGSFAHAITVMIVFIWIGIPVALFLALSVLISLKRSGKITEIFRKVSTISAVVAGSLILSFATGSLIHHWKIRKVRQFVEMTVPSLDEYHSKSGRYPSTLAEIGVSSIPQMLREPYGYSSTPDTFRFEYWDTSGIMDGYEFSSSKREWTYFD